MTNRLIKQAEADLKYGVEEYLQIGKNKGRWLFFRLNSGEFFIGEGERKRRIIGTPKGTADFEVIMRIEGAMLCRTIFLETKSTDGKQRAEQVEFERSARDQGAEYYVIRDLNELFELLPIMKVIIAPGIGQLSVNCRGCQLTSTCYPSQRNGKGVY